MDAQPSYSPSTVEDVFKDFKARRTAMLKALTTDVERFYGECDPEKENLCLYGFPDGNWDVSFPAEEVPPELPEPALGINFARDGMARKDWLSLVAVHSDAWLYAVAFYYGARFDKGDRKRLFDMMNDLPTVFDVVTGRRIVKEKPPNNSNSKVRKTINDVQQQQKNPENNYGRSAKRARPKEDEEEDEEDDDEEEEEEEDEQGDTFCGSCAGAYSKDEFWIACDICEKWYHGLCVKVSASRAANIKQYKCPSCSNKRGRA